MYASTCPQSDSSKRSPASSLTTKPAVRRQGRLRNNLLPERMAVSRAQLEEVGYLLRILYYQSNWQYRAVGRGSWSMKALCRHIMRYLILSD
jgi:hypothetical protein